MRRLITHFNSLFLGMILGTIVLAVIHAPSSHQQEKVRPGRIAIGYEILGEKNETTVLLIAGTTTQLIHLPAEFCAYLGNQGCHASSLVTSASFVRPATHQQVRK
jgi:hypothetical protein